MSTTTPTLTHRLAGVGVAMGIALGAAACSSSTTTTGGSGSTAGGAPSSISLSFSDTGCDPATFTAAAGDVTLNIRNTGTDEGEVEVVTSDQRVKGEAENVAPNFSKAFTANGLTAGTYTIICGSDKAPKGTLTVVGTGGTSEAPGTTTAPGLDAAVDQYRSYIETQGADLQTKTKVLVAAIKAGDLAQAQTLFGPTRQPYESIEPVAESFKDIDDAVDSRVDDHASVDDPTFTGFHKLEHGLFELETTDGLGPVADKLQSDVDTLVVKTKDLDIEPVGMIVGAKDLLEEVASSKITGEEDRYSHTDLFDFRANLDGSQKVFALVEPLVVVKDEALADKIEAGFGDVDKTLTTYENPDGTYKSYDALTEADKQTMSAQIAELSEDLSKLPGVLGLPEPPHAPDEPVATGSSAPK